MPYLKRPRAAFLMLSGFFFVLFLAAFSAQAADRRAGVPRVQGAANSKEVRLGALLGLGAPSSTDLTGGSRMVTGIDAYAWYGKRGEIGASYTTGEAHSRRISLLGMEGNYYFAPATPSLYVGLAFGITSIEFDSSFFPSLDDLYFGPKLGFDHFLTPEVSVGGELKFLFVASGPSYTWMQALFGFRLHF